MDLQFALLIAGAALVAVVVISSLFPAAGAKLKALFNKKTEIRTGDKTDVTHQKRAAPRLGGDDAAMLGEEALVEGDVSLYDVPLINDTHDEALEPNVSEVKLSQEITNAKEEVSESMDAPAIFKEQTHKEPMTKAETTITPELGQVPEEDSSSVSASISEAVPNLDEVVLSEAERVVSEPQEALSESIDVQITPTETYTSLKQIDYWVKLICNTPYSKPLIMDQFGLAWNKMALNAQVHGLNTQDRRWYDFNNLPDNADFEEFVISFQLLNNGHPHSAGTLRRFTVEVDQVAENLSASTQYLSSASEAAVQSANLASLYANCQGHIEVQINPTAEQPFYGKIIESSAKLQGLEFEAGRYVRKKQVTGGQVSLYTLGSVDGSEIFEEMSSESTLKAVKFTMQPAISEHPGRVVKEMLDSAKAYASRVKGELQVFQGVDYHQDHLRQVRDYVSKIEDKMAEAGIPAGSAEAMRLFS